MKRTLPTAPLLVTHWDPDLYPARPLPLLQELIIHILAHGEVWLKEVDLFLNPRIRAFLSKRSNRDVFASLVETGRIKILVPDGTTILERDPQDEPLLAAAMARDGKKPLKSEPWVLTEETKRFCKQLDSILGLTGRKVRNPWARPICRPRVTAPSEKNEFAAKLYGVLTQHDKRWQGRDPFKGISPAMVDQFAEFSQNHDKALALLAAADVTPNATNGFYRSLAYQCADEFRAEGTIAVQAMKNLVQSVYTYCELKREQAAGTYGGDRLAEMPPDKPAENANLGLIRIEVVPLPRSIAIPVDANIGQVISNVLEMCDQSLHVFWNLAGSSPSPEQDFQVAWNHVAEVFAREVQLPQKPAKGGIFRPAGLIIGGATLVIDIGEIAGLSWRPGFVVAGVALGAIATFGPEAVDLFRRAQLELRRQEIDDAVSAAAAIRCSKIA